MSGLELFEMDYLNRRIETSALENKGTHYCFIKWQLPHTMYDHVWDNHEIAVDIHFPQCIPLHIVMSL